MSVPITKDITENAAHPFEDEAVELLRLYLNREGWPFHRLHVDVKFVARSRMASESRTSQISRNGGEQRGTVEVLFNYLFIVQRPGPFLSHVVAHEAAHVMDKVASMRAGRKVSSGHSDQWRAFFARACSEPPREHSEILAWFDDRAIRLLNGWHGGLCSCEESRRFRMLNKEHTEKARIGKLDCEGCHKPIKLVDEDQWPGRVKRDAIYLREEKAFRK